MRLSPAASVLGSKFADASSRLGVIGKLIAQD
jgi:hypothetical protein